MIEFCSVFESDRIAMTEPAASPSPSSSMEKNVSSVTDCLFLGSLH